MKKFYTIVLLVITSVITNAQSWLPKANFAGDARYGAVSFSIGTKGYLGTGNDGILGNRKDFWEWDQATNTWTQKADFGGIVTTNAVGFSIGLKGYIGTGALTTNTNFWEWDGDITSPNYNTWTARGNAFGFPKRSYAVGFSIGTKGYIGTGKDGSTYYQDLWEYDQVTFAWTQKSDFGGGIREKAVGFSIGTKGYIGTGDDGTAGSQKKDFWEWNQATNIWTQKANLSGNRRTAAVGFSIGNKGFIGTGIDTTINSYNQDFWEWNQSTNTWTQRANLSGGIRGYATGFSIGSKGYIGTGRNATTTFLKDFWEYDICSGISLTLNKTNVSCNGAGNGTATVTVVGGSAPFTYLWSNSQTTQTATGLNAITYSITATDGNGCSKTSTVSITQPTSLTTTVSQTNVCGIGNNNGSASATPTGGTAPYTYSWNTTPIQTTQTATGLASGTYTATITDTKGCNVQSTTTITVNPLPTVTLSLTPDTVCINTGAYALTGGSPNGGTYSGNGVSAGNFNPSIAGNGLHDIIYTYTDGNSCTNKDTAKIFVDLCTSVQTISDNKSITVFPNPLSTQTTFHADQVLINALLTVYNSFGQTVVQTDNLSGQLIVFHRDNLPSGLYFIRMTEGNKTIFADKLVIADK